MSAEARFPAMGSTGHVLVVGPRAEHLAAEALARLVDLEARWSRFDPHSEVSRLNRTAGRGALHVSADTALLVRHAVAARDLTSGVFDPTLGTRLVELGYDRPFDELGERAGAPPERTSATTTDRRAGVRTPAGRDATDAPRIRLDDGTGTVELAAGVAFDPGGIGKGLAADIVGDELMAEGAEGVLVGVGGDLRVRGASPDGGPWRIDVADPRDGSVRWQVRLDDGAVATSSPLRRRWVGADGGEVHHLIDPATGLPSQSPVLAATAVTATGWQAEVLAKVALLCGPAGHPRGLDALELVGRVGAAALLVTDRIDLTTARWADLASPIATEVAA